MYVNVFILFTFLEVSELFCLKLKNKQTKKSLISNIQQKFTTTEFRPSSSSLLKLQGSEKTAVWWEVYIKLTNGWPHQLV